jgi:hypothetical protein
MTSQDIVAKLWNLCHVLRDDGITYYEYVTELTFLLFLKMAKETGIERQIPEGYRWDDPHSIGFSGRQRSLDCQRRLPLYFPCAPSSQLHNLSENNLNNISSLKIYH